MITTGQVLTEGTQVFTPIINRLLEITGEFIPYFLFIALGILGVSILRTSVKYIIKYLEGKTKYVFYRQEFESGERRNGVFYSKRKRVKRKKPKRSNFRPFN